MSESDVGKNIKKRRKQLGLSAEQVADKMGVSPATVYRYESNYIMNMGIDKLKKIAEALNTTPAALMGWEQDSIDASAETEADKYEGTDLDSLYDEYEQEEAAGIASKIKQLREEKHIDLYEFSEELGIPVQLLKEYESGERKIPYSIVKKMAAYFNVEEVYLYGIEFKAKHSEGELEATTRRLEQAEIWSRELGDIVFTREELLELINFAKYLISKRNA